MFNGTPEYPNSLFCLFLPFLGTRNSFFYSGSTKVQFEAEIDIILTMMARMNDRIARMVYTLDHPHTTW